MLTDQSQDNVVSKFNIIDFFSNMFLSNVLKKKQVLVFIYPSIWLKVKKIFVLFAFNNKEFIN